MAQIVVPIPGDGGIAGLLYVDRRTRRPFTDADEALMLRLAERAGTAIRNAQLFEAERAARAEADAANRAKDRFLAVLSHELRTPLAAVAGWARILRKSSLKESQRSHALDVIERNAALLAQLVGDLLDMSRIVAGKMDVERRPVDLGAVVQEAVDAVATDVEAKHLRVVTWFDAAAGEVLGDRRRLQQVVMNLLLNAIKFTPERGTVDVRLLRHETSARLTVRDSGQGIERALLSRIFDPFEQGDSSTTRSEQGLGLGLAIARQIVELHGGTIRADSAGKGAGSAFTVDLPVLAVRVVPEADSPQSAGPSGPGIQSLRVLIVDDQADARELLALVLVEHGADVHTVASAPKALDYLDTHAIDVVVSDISMPGTDGYGLIESVRQRERSMGRRLHAVAVTAYMGRDVLERALAAGFDAQATKPVDPEQLLQILTSLRAS